jgi:hypothetical protein
LILSVTVASEPLPPAQVTDELWDRTAKSVFHFDVQGAVAKSTRAGIRWLCYVRRANAPVHFWPFEGWSVPPNRFEVAEVNLSALGQNLAKGGANKTGADRVGSLGKVSPRRDRTA